VMRDFRPGGINIMAFPNIFIIWQEACWWFASRSWSGTQICGI
jgi:hypothetical protein